MKSLTILFRSLALLLISTSPPGLASIIWKAPVSVSTGPENSSDVSTNGVLVEAFNGCLTSYSQGNQVVNGVTFIPTTRLLNSDTSNIVDFSTITNDGDASYDALLSTADYGGGNSTTIVLGDGDGDSTVTGAGLLEVGSRYEIQVWFVDDRSSSDTRVMGFASSSTAPLVEVNDQYVIGTFTATGTTQSLFLDTVLPSSGFGNTHLTAYQIRRLPSGPTPTLATSSTSVSGSFLVTVHFSEPVTGLEAADFTVTNGTIVPGTVTGSGATWSIEVNPASNGEITIELPVGAVMDLDGDEDVNVASNLLAVFYLAPGSDQPSAVLSTPANPVPGPFSVDLVFSEPVSGFDVGDFEVTGGSISSVTGSGASYVLSINPEIVEGDVTVFLPADRVIDLVVVMK